MQDFFDLPNTSEYIQTFYSDGTTTTWQTWNKPKNSKFVYFYMLGGGGGGSAGGGGGASSSITRAYIPSFILPDTLYIQVGVGGVGGVGSTVVRADGDSGTLSYVSTQPNILRSNLILASGNAAATGGLTGNTGGGTGGTAFTIANGLISSFSIFQSNGGQNGGAGGNTSGVGVSITIALPVSAGAGGGGQRSVNNGGAGGVINAGVFSPSIDGGSQGTALVSPTSGINGYGGQLPSSNLSLKQPPFFTGGSGGGGNGSLANSVGGSGGDGQYGCGGGGGGNTDFASGRSSGNGGKGGDGLVIIMSI